MSKRPSDAANAATLLSATVGDADTKLNARIEIGEELLTRLKGRGAGGREITEELAAWNAYNAQLLRRLFTSDELVKEFNLAGPRLWRLAGERDASPQARIDNHAAKLAALKSIVGRLELYAPQLADEMRIGEVRLPGTRVFIVHGHHDALRESVARVIERVGLTPTILHEQPNSGRTIIEKFEAQADVDFAVVLLTGDDEGRALKDGSIRARARQNVVFELGYFFGALGRKRVCALYEPGVELPSDIQGLVYVPIDAGGAWRFSLAQELRAAGFTIDVNNLLAV